MVAIACAVEYNTTPILAGLITLTVNEFRGLIDALLLTTNYNHLLIRRNDTTGELAYLRCYSHRAVSLRVLAGVGITFGQHPTPRPGVHAWLARPGSCGVFLPGVSRSAPEAHRRGSGPA